MLKLSKSHSSKAYLEKRSGQKPQPISQETSKKLEQASQNANEKIRLNNSVYNQSNSHSTETIVGEKTPVENFVDNIDKMKNPHIRDGASLDEKYGTIEDYSEYQEQRDLKSYKRFINSSAYDDIKETESEIGKRLKLVKQKINYIHDD